MSRYIKKALYDPETGDVSHLMTYPSDEAAELHFLRSRSKKPGEVMADITDEEYSAFQELTPAGRLTHVMDTGKARRKLHEREKEEYEIHEYGVSWNDFRPVSAVRRRDQMALEIAGDINSLIPDGLLRALDFSRDINGRKAKNDANCDTVNIVTNMFDACLHVL